METRTAEQSTMYINTYKTSVLFDVKYMIFNMMLGPTVEQLNAIQARLC